MTRFLKYALSLISLFFAIWIAIGDMEIISKTTKDITLFNQYSIVSEVIKTYFIILLILVPIMLIKHGNNNSSFGSYLNNQINLTNPSKIWNWLIYITAILNVVFFLSITNDILNLNLLISRIEFAIFMNPDYVLQTSFMNDRQWIYSCFMIFMFNVIIFSKSRNNMNKSFVYLMIISPIIITAVAKFKKYDYGNQFFRAYNDVFSVVTNTSIIHDFFYDKINLIAFFAISMYFIFIFMKKSFFSNFKNITLVTVLSLIIFSVTSVMLSNPNITN